MAKTVHGITGNNGLGVRRKPLSERRTPYIRINGRPEHRLIVEQRIGMRLPDTAHVHHVDPDDKLTNKGLFVVCQDAAYHQLIERRGRALRECGHANWWKCYRCGKWDRPENLFHRTRKTRNGKPTGVMSEMLHAKVNGVCVDMPEPIAPEAWTCTASGSGRHNVKTRGSYRPRGWRAGTEATCSHCQQTIRRIGPDSVRWYAVNVKSTLLSVCASPSMAGPASPRPEGHE